MLARAWRSFFILPCWFFAPLLRFPSIPSSQVGRPAGNRSCLLGQTNEVKCFLATPCHTMVLELPGAYLPGTLGDFRPKYMAGAT